MPVIRYAVLSYPGILFPETETVMVSKKTLPKTLFKKHKGCYKVQFYSRTERRVKGELLTGPETYEKKSFLHGKAHTLAKMKARKPALDRILISNVEINGWKGAVECVTGNWQPWTDDIEVLP